MNMVPNGETDRQKRVAQILATDVTREQLADAIWCCEDVIRRRDENDLLLHARINELCERIEEMVEVVRCRDCIHGKPFVHDTRRCSLTRLSFQGDFYCAHGERREDAT